MYHFNLTESEQVFDGILWLEDQLQSPKEFIAYSNARNTIALAKVLMGKFEEAAQLIEKSNQVAHKYNNGVLRMRNEFALGLSYFYQGMNEKALEHMGIAINIAENNYNWRFIIETLSVTSHVHLAKGKSIASFECIQNAYNLAKAYQYTGLHGVLINAEGKIHLAYGNHKQAIHLFEEAMKFSTNERYFLMSQSWKSFAQASLGNFDDPIHRMEQIRAEADKKRWAELWMKSSAHLGISLYLAGNVKEALDVLKEYGKKAKELGFGSAGAAFAYVQAKEAIKQSNYDLVRANGKILLETSTREKSLWLQWLALELMLAGESEGELEPANYKIQLKHVVREINQSKPAWINFDHDPNKPSLFGLV
jgi:tetratricopeptide (TPR) repeat protein